MGEKSPKLNKRNLVVAITVLVIFVVAATSYFYFSNKKSEKDQDTNTDQTQNNVNPNTNIEKKSIDTINPSFEIIYPKEGQTLGVGENIKINTSGNLSNTELQIIVSSDKRGIVYDVKKQSTNNELDFIFEPSATLNPGTSGNVIVSLEKDGTKISEKSIWVNF